MQLLTPVPIQPPQNPISYEGKLLSMGSCFAVHIAQQLQEVKFDCMSNPFGILFHPKAIETVFKRMVANIPFEPKDVFETNGLWKSFEVHSEWYGTSANELVTALNTTLDKTHDYLKKCSHLLITLGTAWGYRLKDTQQWVANCHKQPQNLFSKELITIPQTTECLEKMSASIRLLNPTIQIIFTISPVRHLKDGMIENQQSKASLIIALHEFLAKYPEGNHYFPAYEIMQDELRDYRFYKADLLHPNEMAIQYIWEKFSTHYFSEETQKMKKEIEDIQKALHHRPLHPDSLAHRKFVENTSQRIEKIKQRYPTISFES